MLLTAKQAAEMLQIHRNTLYKWVKEGRVPVLHVGSNLRFREDVVMRVVERSNNES